MRERSPKSGGRCSASESGLQAEHRSSPRMLVAWLPGFRLERCGWTMRDAVVLVGESERAVRVLSATPPAYKSGIRLGMTLASARALSPEVSVEWLDGEGERADLKELSVQLGRVSPRVDALPPDAIGLELERWPVAETRRETAPAREAAAMERVHSHLRALGHASRVVVADDLLGARAVAIWGAQKQDRPHWIAPGQLPAALASLPVHALELPIGVQERLRTLGIHTVEALAKLPPAAMRDRFGREAWRAHERARGCLSAQQLPVLPEHPPFWRQEQLPFLADTVEAICFILHRLLGSLCEELDNHQMAATRVVLVLDLEDSPSRTLRFRTGRCARDVGVLSRLLRRRLEGLHLDGAVCGVTLSLPGAQAFLGDQPRLLERGTTAEALPALLARLGDTLGARAVISPRDQNRWRPEAAWAPQALIDTDPTTHEAPLDRSKDPVWPHERWREDGARARPLLLLPEARPIEMFPDRGRPRRVCIEGRWFEVVAVCALEALSGEWWADGFERTYLGLGLADGRWAWVYRAWGHLFLHGWFDQGGPIAPRQEG